MWYESTVAGVKRLCLADGSRIFVGVSVTHSICICEIHGNTKLLINGVNLSELYANDINLKCLALYKTMLSSMTCDSKTPSCYLKSCKSCPDVQTLIEKRTKALRKQFNWKRHVQWLGLSRSCFSGNFLWLNWELLFGITNYYPSRCGLFWKGWKSRLRKLCNFFRRFGA